MRRHISEGIEEYLKEKPVPWHMPGHKRKGIGSKLDDIYIWDLTEVPGVDDLHHPEGMIKDSLNELKNIYGTFASYYLVNGATCGIHIAIAACREYGKKIVVARNCHKSVINGAMLMGLAPVFVEPEKISENALPDIYGEITADALESVLRDEKDICAVVITSPTYEGVLSDIESIKSITDKYGVWLIVDEAHGAHLPFMEDLGKSAVKCGGDIVVQSLHKTMPAMTQTAILHNNVPKLDDNIKKYMSVFMTTSPSYIMLRSMEDAIAWGVENNHFEYIKCLMNFREKVSSLKYLKLVSAKEIKTLGAYDYDESRIVITTVNNLNSGKTPVITGDIISSLLVKLGNIVVEMSGTDYVVLISTPMDSKEDFEHLYNTLCAVDKQIENYISGKDVDLTQVGKSDLSYTPEYIMSLIGTTAKDNIYVYPPGNYILTVGEEITEDVAKQLINNIKSKKTIWGKL